MTVADALHDAPVTDLDLSRHVIATGDDSVADTIDRMSAAGYTCALVSDGGQLAGIFTQRDVLTRVVGHPGRADDPITELMTEAPRTIKSSQSVAEALAIMNELWVRSVPVLDDDSTIRGTVSFYVLMQLIAELLADHALATPTEVSAHHGLEFVDLTGLNTSSPATVHLDDTLEAAVDMMMTLAVGTVFVVDPREHLSGVITEFDLQAKGAWKESDLASRLATDFMTPDPPSLSARSPIAEAIQEMAASGVSHVPLLGESGRPIAVASFRDIANYLETSVGVLE